MSAAPGGRFDPGPWHSGLKDPVLPKLARGLPYTVGWPKKKVCEERSRLFCFSIKTKGDHVWDSKKVLLALGDLMSIVLGSHYVPSSCSDVITNHIGSRSNVWESREGEAVTLLKAYIQEVREEKTSFLRDHLPLTLSTPIFSCPQGFRDQWSAPQGAPFLPGPA